MARTHYEWLEVAENASTDVIKGAYKYLVQKLHPDKNPDDPELARLLMREITIAFKTLSDPEARAEYDRWLVQQRLSNPAFDRRRPRSASAGAGPQPDGVGGGTAKPAKKRTNSKFVDTWV